MSETFLYIFLTLGLFSLKMLVQFGSFPLKNYPPLFGCKKMLFFFAKNYSFIPNFLCTFAAENIIFNK